MRVVARLRRGNPLAWRRDPRLRRSGQCLGFAPPGFAAVGAAPGFAAVAAGPPPGLAAAEAGAVGAVIAGAADPDIEGVGVAGPLSFWSVAT